MANRWGEPTVGLSRKSKENSVVKVMRLTAEYLVAGKNDCNRS
jgi:hypothetical protein